MYTQSCLSTSHHCETEVVVDEFCAKRQKERGAHELALTWTMDQNDQRPSLPRNFASLSKLCAGCGLSHKEFVGTLGYESHEVTCGTGKCKRLVATNESGICVAAEKGNAFCAHCIMANGSMEDNGGLAWKFLVERHANARRVMMGDITKSINEEREMSARTVQVFLRKMATEAYEARPSAALCVVLFDTFWEKASLKVIRLAVIDEAPEIASRTIGGAEIITKFGGWRVEAMFEEEPPDGTLMT